MTTLEELATIQSTNGTILQQIITNYKKDSDKRKVSAAYYEERLHRLTDAWSNFQEIDAKIKKLPALDFGHSYFTEDYYTKLKTAYETYQRHFEDKIEEFKRTEVQSGEAVSRRADSQPLQEMPQDITTRLLRAIRGQKRVMESLRRILRSLTTDNQTTSYYDIKKGLIQQQWNEIEEYDRSIWELTSKPETIGYQSQEYISLEEETQDWMVLLSTRRDSLHRQEAQSQAAAEVNTMNSAMPRLPKLTLPRFDGDYMKWRQFHDLFTQLVDHQAMPNCQKMWYLKTNLTGEAERLVRHFLLSDDSYESAWKTLTDRYNNTRVLVSALLNKLLSQPSHANDSPTAINLKSLHDTTQECLLGLRNLNVSTEGWDPILLHILIKKLDKASHLLYEQTLANPRELPRLEEFLCFLENRFQSLEVLGTKPEHNKRQGATKTLTSLVSTSQATNECILCKGNHFLYGCRVFLDMTPSNRLTTLRKHNLCINCLKAKHYARRCTSRSCTKCNERHNTLVHLDVTGKTAQKQTREEPATASTVVAKNSKTVDPKDYQDQFENNKTNSLSLTAFQSQPHRGYVLLGTAMVRLVTPEGNSLECRALLDSGSQINLITERVAKKLKLQPNADLMFIEGIGRGKRESQQRINVKIQSILNGFNAHLEAFVLPHIISEQPTQYLNISTWSIPQNIKLADPNFNRPEKIDILLGAEFYHQLLSIGQIRLGEDLPILQNTVFGWILTGRIAKSQMVTATCGICTEDEEETSRLMEKFWKLEELGPNESLTIAEERCESHFTQTFQRDKEGRFIVRLPFAENSETLGDSSQVALNRFIALERRLAKNSSLRELYVEFMKEYSRLGHMIEIMGDEIPSPHYFLPHHCVLKPESSTTKLRVVFDASAKTSTGYSLNDVLYTGPTLQSDLFSILIRFRMPRFVFTTDIQQMYRQILVHEDDRRYQLIYWRSDPKEPVRCYKLCTVTYGTRPAPYLATKCLQRLAEENRERYPLGSYVLQNDFYMDDGMTGSDSIINARETQKQLTTILQQAGFKLRKWCANHPQLLQGIPLEDQEIALDFTNEIEEGIKTLGLTWLPKTDNFRVRVNWNEKTQVTKRIVSSDLARLFDPLGIMGPVVVTAKIFCQQLWQLKLNWDEALPLELHTKWITFRHNLRTLDNIEFPRHVFAKGVPKGIQMHAFADASEKAYGAAVYIRSIDKTSRIIVRLLCAKSRVAPIQKQTLPRLELCAAVLAAQLVARVKADLKNVNIQSYFWTDSEIVLAWINSPSSSYQTFVSNRISKIQSLSRVQQWRHVRSKDNPADILSRGLSPEKLKCCNLWFFGPLFLHGEESVWPAPYNKKLQIAEPLEIKRGSVAQTAVATSEPADIIYQINHGNSFRRLQRIVAFILRFISHIRVPGKPRPESRCPTPTEMERALHIIVKAMQGPDFKEELRCLKKFKELNKASPIHNLSPFVDDQGILRVGGRIKESTLSYDAKHPILLPYADKLTKLLLNDIHKENLHCGPQTLLSHARQKFWPIKGKSIARSIVQHCVRCNKAKPKLMSQLMGNLPATRVQPARPFIHSGVDFCGPIWIHYKIRGKKPQKAYIAVFCCFTTKAIHMELVSDLSTEAFIGALKRFISRRGHCQKLYCDNATNFVGARNKLEELTRTIYSTEAKESIASICTNKGIEFHFIPPRAPHFGGLWEAAVKSAKHLLVRSVSAASLTYEELETVVVEIEAVLNSRPITPMSSDPNDLSALTPGHFLIGEPLTSQVDPNATMINRSILTRWKLVTHLKQEFWNRWSKEYLNELQYRHKWKQQCQNIEPNNMVIIKDDNLPVMQWPLGRVIEVYKGEDGLVRVVDVKTASGILRRPIHRLAPLPLEEETDTGEQVDKETEGPPRSITRKEERPRKKMKMSYGSVLTTLFLICTMMPGGRGSPITINQFESNPGIHFEGIGVVNSMVSEWKIVVYYDLEPYWTEVTALTNGSIALQHLCAQIQLKSTCNGTVNQFEHIKSEIALDNNLLPPKRQKRGAADFVGNIANALFGVLDSEYAKQMSETIDAINRNEQHLVHVLRNQTSIIDSTINILKRDQIATERRFKALEDHMNQIINRINDTGEASYQQKMVQLFNSLAIQMMIMASNIKNMQSLIIDALTDIHHGRISHVLLSSHQLREEMNNIKNHLPASMKLPASQDDIVLLYKLMTAEGTIVNNHVIFRIKLPLIDQIQYDIFRVIPIPVYINNTFVAINSVTPYIAFNSHRDQYYPLSDKALSSCHIIKGTTHICSNVHPIYHKGSRVCSCEVSLFNNMTEGDCDLRKTDNTPIWIQLNHGNQWIYAMNKPTRMNAVCGAETSQIILKGSGMLKLQPDCVIMHEQTTIKGRYIVLSNIKTSYTSFGALSEISKPEKLAPLLQETIHYHAQLKELANLYNATQEVIDLPKRIESHNRHQFTIGYLALALVIMLLSYVIWQLKTKIFTCNKKPTPRPRSQPTPEFTVNV